MFLRGEVPRTVSLLTVIKSWALLATGRVQEPGGVKVLYAKDDEKVDEQVEHLVGSPLIEQVPQVEWQSLVGTQRSPSSVKPLGQSATHSLTPSSLKYGVRSGQSLLPQNEWHFSAYNDTSCKILLHNWPWVPNSMVKVKVAAVWRISPSMML